MNRRYKNESFVQAVLLELADDGRLTDVQELRDGAGMHPARSAFCLTENPEEFPMKQKK